MNTLTDLLLEIGHTIGTDTLANQATMVISALIKTIKKLDSTRIKSFGEFMTITKQQQYPDHIEYSYKGEVFTKQGFKNIEVKHDILNFVLINAHNPINALKAEIKIMYEEYLAMAAYGVWPEPKEYPDQTNDQEEADKINEENALFDKDLP